MMYTGPAKWRRFCLVRNGQNPTWTHQGLQTPLHPTAALLFWWPNTKSWQQSKSKTAAFSQSLCSVFRFDIRSETVLSHELWNRTGQVHFRRNSTEQIGWKWFHQNVFPFDDQIIKFEPFERDTNWEKGWQNHITISLIDYKTLIRSLDFHNTQ